MLRRIVTTSFSGDVAIVVVTENHPARKVPSNGERSLAGLWMRNIEIPSFLLLL